MKSFKDMTYMELVEERDNTQTRLDNSKEGSQEWHKARLRLRAIKDAIEVKAEENF